MVAVDLGPPRRTAGDAAPAMEPFQQFIVKVHSRCNLSCDYCYVYHHVDQSWRDRPTVMSAQTIEALADRIGQHAATHALRKLFVLLHGGEPLLAGPAVIEHVITSVRARVPAATEVDVSVQTNGTLVNDEFLGVFDRHRVAVGVSMDGGREAHDRHRRYADGRPSFDLVKLGLDRLKTHGDIWTGLLLTIDLANDPVRTYEDLVALRPPSIDLLLPLANWVHPPPHHDPASTRYATWLIRVFDRWFDAPVRETGVRLFESIIMLILGGASDTEAIGLDGPRAITIETDGSLEVTDALKTTAPGLGALGMSIHDHSLDEAAGHPAVRATGRGLATLGTGCQICPVVTTCGGGQYSHRFGADGGFAQPSVYCRDLYRLIAHIRGRVADALEARGRQH
ncbi:FxsB family cyclophane-forming radical SAM/SPASM peptide maturase [Actinoplanes sp. NPDC048988]|uniref:FxsB family cyclophane-forming radical SAM/SPASM peptide maturase n=1 Tax=Actinoplanes sp. NPDC048988 TaxID=3363901 RepID=UPI00371E85B9